MACHGSHGVSRRVTVVTAVTAGHGCHGGGGRDNVRYNRYKTTGQNMGLEHLYIPRLRRNVCERHGAAVAALLQHMYTRCASGVICVSAML